MDFRDDINIFKKLGLSQTQAKVYATLCNLRQATINQIAVKSGLGREHIYRIMPSLIEKGIIEKAIAKPNRYKCLPEKEVISILLQIKSQETKKIAEETEEFLQKIEKRMPKFKDKEEENFVLIPKMKGFAIRIKKEFDNVKSSVDVLTTCASFSAGWNDFVQDIKKAALRGVKFRTILTDCDENTKIENFPSLNEWVNVTRGKIRYIMNDHPIVLAIHDNQNVLMSIDPSLTLTKSAALFSTNSTLVEISKKHFETLWSTSKEILY